MTTPRDAILKSIRSHLLEARELPSLDRDWIAYENRIAQFAESLAGVVGTCIAVADTEELNRELGRLPQFAEAKRVCSLVAGVGESNVDVEGIDDPHQLEDVDFAVLPGRLGVAENAAVWVTDEGVKHRVLYFLVQHLALVLPADQVVDHMHAAYEQLAGEPRAATLEMEQNARKTFRVPGFGAFISGPSKTADIEQSLVIGAHGPRSLTVFLVGAK